MNLNNICIDAHSQPQVFHEIKLNSNDTLVGSGLVPGTKITILTHGFDGSFDLNYDICQKLKNGTIPIFISDDI